MTLGPDHSPFVQSLLRSSQELCGRALDAFTAADHRSFYLSGGIALEHAAKAALSSLHPVLIADGRSFESMLALAQAPFDVTPIAASLRTVGLRDALD